MHWLKVEVGSKDYFFLTMEETTSYVYANGNCQVRGNIFNYVLVTGLGKEWNMILSRRNDWE